MPLLTKSNYLLGLQCPKLLWVSKNDKERIPKPDEIAHAKFKTGDIIGVLATKVFSDGIDLSELDFKENINKTKESLELRKPIFEAGFLEEDLFSRGDILLPVGVDEWDIIEVKSATKLKDINIHDVSFQKYVYEKAGLKIRHCILMHINNQYVKSGEIEPNELFTQTDITEQVEHFSEGIEKRIENMLKIINSKEEPKCSLGVHCSNPYDCPLKEECWKDVPEESIFEFYRMLSKKKFVLYDSGVVKLNEVPDSVKLNDKQKIQKLLAEKGGTHSDKKQIDFFLENLQYPIYYLDFETINPAIPKFDGMKPYQRIPFQFSLHIQEKPNGKLKHISFLAEGISDPRPKFMQALKDNLAKKGSILVYNQGFEKGVLKECSDALPEFKEWYEKNILPRIKDLWDVFKDFSYYDPKQKGSTSIKYVLPVLSDLSYKMDIKNGALASLEYERVTYGNVSDKEREKIRKQLEKYCELDTLAEVEIVKALTEIVK
ncbi:DUF2779 domain-containing protein [Candidatus Pacearchaeota archaeon]|nr:MAG: DUF2779 domain-containing protein [Candidatus Pacearchaeota archaeon]